MLALLISLSDYLQTLEKSYIGLGIRGSSGPRSPSPSFIFIFLKAPGHHLWDDVMFHMLLGQVLVTQVFNVRTTKQEKMKLREGNVEDMNGRGKHNMKKKMRGGPIKFIKRRKNNP